MTLSRLRGLQERVHDYLLGEGDGSAMRDAIVDDGRVGAEERLKIYHDAYRLRLIEALSKAYPNLGKLLGDELFDRTARAYIVTHPSRYRNLRWYGGELAEHLADALPQHPVASELARFEWTLALAFDSADTPVLSGADLVTVSPEDWGRLRFSLHPSAWVLDMNLNTVAVWQALNEDRTPPSIKETTSSWLIWRKGLNPHFRSLEPGESSSLALIVKGACFAEVCEALSMSDAEPDSAIQAAGYLAGWLGDGLLSRMTPGVSDPTEQPT